jgi:hypothetical protein
LLVYEAYESTPQRVKSTLDKREMGRFIRSGMELTEIEGIMQT